jgi:hypothetical protein
MRYANGRVNDKYVLQMAARPHACGASRQSLRAGRKSETDRAAIVL